MAIEQQTDQAAQARTLLITQYKGKEALEAIQNAWVNQIQDLEDAFFQLFEERGVDTAVGTQLEVLGAIVGQDKLADSDDQYRLRIKARIRANISSGTPEELMSILRLLTANVFEFLEWAPAAFTFIIHDELVEDPAIIAAMLTDARSAAIGSSLEYTLADDDDTFTFATGDTAEADVNEGWSNDGATSGGKFADAVEI